MGKLSMRLIRDLILFMFLGVAFTPNLEAHKRGKIVLGPNCICGINMQCNSKFSPYELVSQGKEWTYSQDDFNEIIRISRAFNWPIITKKERKLGLLLPQVIATRGGQNAEVMERTVSKLEGRRALIVFDDDWIRKLEDKVGSSWVRTAILAHELGHVYHGHVFGRGPKSRWDQEFEADIFTGYVLFKMGATLKQAQALFHYVALDKPGKNPNSHPYLSDRLNAVRIGWKKAGGRISRNPTESLKDIYIHYGSAYPYGVSVGLRGKTYSFRFPQTLRLSLIRDTEVLYLWEAPGGQGRWSPFTVKAGNTYRVEDASHGRLTLNRLKRGKRSW